MIEVREVTTPRLLLRSWWPTDEAVMAEINGNPEVTRHLNRPVDATAVAGFYAAMVTHWATYGYGPWAIESREAEHVGEFLGFAGLAHLPPFLSDAGSGPELGWRLRRDAWGRGLATEAATAARDHAFRSLHLPELISVIHPDNERSQRVATKLGMTPTREVFNTEIDRTVQVWTVRA